MLDQFLIALFTAALKWSWYCFPLNLCIIRSEVNIQWLLAACCSSSPAVSEATPSVKEGGVWAKGNWGIHLWGKSDTQRISKLISSRYPNWLSRVEQALGNHSYLLSQECLYISLLAIYMAWTVSCGTWYYKNFDVLLIGSGEITN